MVEADMPGNPGALSANEFDGEGAQLVGGRGAHSITARLKRAIEMGVYADGDQLPPERQLAVAFGTARSTIRKALDQLKDKGLVLRRVGSGTFVNYKGPLLDSMADVTDLISPRGPIDRSEATAAVGEVLRKYGITGATVAGGHGTLAKQADIGPALAAR